MRGVLSCPQPEAAEVGRRVLLEGGNAVDAAVATAFAQFIVDPQMCGVGGWGLLQVYHGPTGEHICLEFYGRAPLRATPDMFADRVKRRLRFDLWELEGHVNELGYLSVTCPGTVLGLWELHRRYGSRPWGDLLQPAIRLAEEGFTVPEELAALWRREPRMEGTASMYQVLTATPASRRIYIKPNGQPYDTGETFRNPDYANTLRELARHGPDVLYRGWMARRIAEEFARNGGLLTEEDFRQYRVGVSRPLTITYRGHTVALTPPPSSGVQVGEALLILAGFDLGRMGFGSADYFYTMAMAQKASFVDRAKYLGDPAFRPVPVQEVFLSPEHAAWWREQILRHQPFEVPGVDTPEPAHTTTISAMDEQGTAVALTHTLSTPASGVVVEGLGFMFNNAMQAFYPFPGHPNSIAPGKARTTGMAPVILFREGRPWSVVSGMGATKILTGVLQGVVNLIDFGMSPQEAVCAPRVHCEGGWADLEARAYFAVHRELEERGLRVVKSALSFDPFFALVHIAQRDPDTGEFQGGADPRGRGGLALVQ